MYFLVKIVWVQTNSHVWRVSVVVAGSTLAQRNNGEGGTCVLGGGVRSRNGLLIESNEFIEFFFLFSCLNCFKRYSLQTPRHHERHMKQMQISITVSDQQQRESNIRGTLCEKGTSKLREAP